MGKWGCLIMQDELKKVMVAAWEYAKEVIKTNPQDLRDWKYVYSLRQELCDQFEQNTTNYRFVRKVTSDFLDWYEDMQKEGKE